MGDMPEYRLQNVLAAILAVALLFAAPGAAGAAPPGQSAAEPGALPAADPAAESGAGATGETTAEAGPATDDGSAAETAEESAEESTSAAESAGETAEESAGESAGESVPEGIRLYLDDREIFLDEPIQVLQGRTLMPVQPYASLLGAELTFDENQHTVSMIRDKAEVVFRADAARYTVNGVARSMPDAAYRPASDEAPALIPLRYGAEPFGYIVDWTDTDGHVAVHIRSTPASRGELRDNEISIAGRLVWLGQPLASLIENLGNPDRIDESAYDLRWYVYNRDYSRFVMVGVRDDLVAGFFSNSVTLSIKGGLLYGAKKQEISAAGIDEETMQLWLDPNNDDSLYAVFCVADKPGEEAQMAVFDRHRETLLRAYEMECFDATNAFRLASGTHLVGFDSRAASSALAYAKDMAEKGFMDHINPQGMNPLERLEERGIYAWQVSENLAGGFGDAIQVMKAWVESASHREGMLEDNQYLGVGAYYKPNSRYRFYFVQEFITLDAPKT